MEQERNVIVTEEDIAKAWEMSRLKYELDESHKHSVWLKQGRKEAASQRDYEIARSLLSDGFSIEKVVQYTGLTLDTIQGLNANLSHDTMEHKETIFKEQEREVTVTEEDIAKAWEMSRLKYELDESHKHSVWIKQGRKLANIIVTKRLAEMDKPIDFISKVIELPESEIRAIIDYTDWRSTQSWIDMTLDEAMENAVALVENMSKVTPQNPSSLNNYHLL
jgi:hypothetical protein